MAERQFQYNGREGGATQRVVMASDMHDEQPVLAVGGKRYLRMPDHNDILLRQSLVNCQIETEANAGEISLHNDDHNDGLQPQVTGPLQQLGVNILSPPKSQGLFLRRNMAPRPEAVDGVFCAKSRLKVVAPESPDPEPEPEPYRVNLVKRKAEEEKTSGRTDYSKSEQAKQTRKLVEEINTNVERKEQAMKKQQITLDALGDNFSLRPLASPKCIIYDDTMFSGFGPECNLENMFENSDKGSFGQVVPFQDKETKEKLMVKKIKGTVAINELEVPLNFQSPNIQKVVALGYDDVNAYLVLQNAGRNLKRSCEDPHQRDILTRPEQLCPLTRDLLQAICLLARSGITHCDIKAENVCLKWCEELGRFVATLIDFGSSKSLQDPMSFNGITGEYLPPSFNAMYYRAWMSIRAQQKPSKLRRLNTKDDVYAVGMIMSFIRWGVPPMIKYLTGRDMYPSDISIDQRMQVLKTIGEFKDVLPREFLEYPECPEVEPLLAGLLELEEDLRLSAEEALGQLEDIMGIKRPPARKVKRVCMSTASFIANTHPAQPGLTVVQGPSSRGQNKELRPKIVVLKQPPRSEGVVAKHEVVPQPGMLWKGNGVLRREPMVEDLSMAQASGYMDIDRKQKKLLSPVEDAVVDRSTGSAHRQRRLEEEPAWGNQADVGMDEIQELTNSFACSPVKQQPPAWPQLLRESSVVDLSRRPGVDAGCCNQVAQARQRAAQPMWVSQGGQQQPLQEFGSNPGPKSVQPAFNPRVDLPGMTGNIPVFSLLGAHLDAPDDL
ncbi:uncharacterized protein LOC101862792 [Aplysia californica]|uniref:Uncharacterized protein LOC101862792 n=1 Tax=Aplysia californica TaxID=6500 RepID=A0ABM0JMB8_APLCA|nr:uncharacterized protein LOC101862792 [Aplysia californica]